MEGLQKPTSELSARQTCAQMQRRCSRRDKSRSRDQQTRTSSCFPAQLCLLPGRSFHPRVCVSNHLPLLYPEQKISTAESPHAHRLQATSSRSNPGEEIPVFASPCLQDRLYVCGTFATSPVLGGIGVAGKWNWFTSSGCAGLKSATPLTRYRSSGSF